MQNLLPARGPSRGFGAGLGWGYSSMVEHLTGHIRPLADKRNMAMGRNHLPVPSYSLSLPLCLDGLAVILSLEKVNAGKCFSSQNGSWLPSLSWGESGRACSHQFCRNPGVLLLTGLGFSAHVACVVGRWG